MVLKSILDSLNNLPENQRDTCLLADLIYGDNCLRTHKRCDDCCGKKWLLKVSEEFIDRCV